MNWQCVVNYFCAGYARTLITDMGKRACPQHTTVNELWLRHEAAILDVLMGKEKEISFKPSIFDRMVLTVVTAFFLQELINLIEQEITNYFSENPNTSELAKTWWCTTKERYSDLSGLSVPDAIWKNGAGDTFDQVEMDGF